LAKVTDTYTTSPGKLVVLCDCTPPRSGDPAALDRVGVVNADYICVAYNPGKLARADSVAAAFTIKERTGKDVVFNMATRDMNKIAMQSRLLGAQMMGLENVVVLQGDGFTEIEAAQVKAVDDFTPTGLVAAISGINDGLDYRGTKLRGATDFCIGATLDLERDLEREVNLVQRKIAAGAHYFIVQPMYDLALRQRFLDAYEKLVGEPLTTPVFWGLQVLDKDGIVLGSVPSQMRQELDGGRSGSDIASELLQQYVSAGIRGVYLVPPILRGGGRDYDAAQQVLESV
jgi:5,10-methylenetetrahydrofolate reductase